MSESPRLLSLNAAALALGVSTVSMYRWTTDGRLPYVRLGSRKFISAETVARIVAGELALQEVR